MTTKNREHHEVSFGKQRIPFSLEFRDRERLAISVNPDRTVSVVAPTGRSVEEVLGRVQMRAGWIVKQRMHFDQFHPLTPPRRFVSGETHLYLGRQYRLKVIKSKDSVVKLVGRFLLVQSTDRDDAAGISQLLDDWYLDHARKVFARRLDACLEMARSLSLSTPEVVVRKMSKRWGSCTKSGRILLNIELVKTPLHCVDYVIMHELCHLKIHDHSPRFYRLLSRCMPDWEKRKKKLESIVM
jgi:predicted metal-dependent hydrolase